MDLNCNIGFPTLLDLMASSWGRKGVQRTVAQSREGERFVINEPDVHAWNIDGSASDRLRFCSWIRKWEEEAGQIRGRCAYQGCEGNAEHGGHVWVKRKGAFLVPICARCNSPTNPDRMQNERGNHSNLKLGTVAVGLGPRTKDMRRSDRRISTDSRAGPDRWCEHCDKDINDRPPGHTVCYACYSSSSASGGGRSSGAKRKRAGPDRCCEHCGKDINDRPPGHTVCYACYRSSSASGGGSSQRDEWCCSICYASHPTFRAAAQCEERHAAVLGPRCEHCGKDISDRPAGHTVCYACYRSGPR